MKNELKISTLTIVCVLCATAFSGAYGASTVRTLGGTGTYTSASAASASNTGVARAGAVRVTPSSGKAVATTKSTATTSATSSAAGRVSTAPRLSLGKYLGTTTVNRPNSGTSSSGTSNPGLSGDKDYSQDIADLQKQIDDASKQLETALNAVDKLKETVESMAIQGVADGGYIVVDNDGMAYLDVDALGKDSSAEVVDNTLYITIADSQYPIKVDLPDLLSSDDMNATLEKKLEEYLTVAEFEKWKDTVEVLGKTGDDLKEALESKADVADLAAKADKLTTGNYTVGNIATVGANGQYVDGGVSVDSFATDDDLKEFAEKIGATENGQVVNKFETLKTEINNNMTEMLKNDLSFTEINANGDLVIKEGSITSRELAPNSVTSVELANGAVKEENLAETITKQLIGDGYTDAAGYPGGLAVMLVDEYGNKIWTPLEFADATPDPDTGGN
ncbi:MAG: hypothetical protein NC311_03700 [Muribaculaceae bacterium]|nr:hypothetical protein [Muribaculaceae bacterium]